MRLFGIWLMIVLFSVSSWAMTGIGIEDVARTPFEKVKEFAKSLPENQSPREQIASLAKFLEREELDAAQILTSKGYGHMLDQMSNFHLAQKASSLDCKERMQKYSDGGVRWFPVVAIWGVIFASPWIAQACM